MRLSQHPSLLLAASALLLISSTSGQNLPTIGTTGNVAIPVATSGATAAATSDGTSATDSGSKTTGSGSKSTDASSTDDSSETGLPAISSSAAATSETGKSSSPPRLSTSTDSGSLPSGLPKLPGGFTYPPPSVPPTAGAPYMQKSSLPEGTIFIVVGAVLGFFGLFVLAWRGLVAWSINRSVKRAAMKSRYQNYAFGSGVGDSKSLLRNHKNPYTDGPGSTITLEKLGTHHQRTSTTMSKSHTPASSLFFSPTAGTGMHTNHRNSGYLPAGYYTAGSSQLAGGNTTTHIGGPGRPTSQGYVRPRSNGPSPPVSPSLPPSSRGQDGITSNLGVSTQASSSTLNLNAPTQGRAPSAYLEDLFENHAPGQRQSRQ